MKKISKKITFTILSISLLTVMAGAAIAPALSIISQHFADYPQIVVQLIISLPALFIIITNLSFASLCKHLSTRTIAIAGLLLYICSGAGCYFIDNIYLILLLRAVLGISVGMIMPLSTGLLAFYFPPEEQAHLMGLSAAMNQMGGVVATLLAGLLATVEWNYSFLVYLLGILSLLLVIVFLPNEHLRAQHSTISVRSLLRFHPSVVGMFLLMTLFFVFPSNFAITTRLTTDLSQHQITLIMVGLDVIAFFVGLAFGWMMLHFRNIIKYFAPICFLAGYACYAYGVNATWLIIGSVLIGIANGVGIPYLNTIASIKGGKDSAVTVMPLLSASLYLGQFLSPLIVNGLNGLCYSDASPLNVYKIAIAISIVFLLQVVLTRRQQFLPPEQ